MGIIRLLKPGLFIYECARILILAAFLVFQSVISAGDSTGFQRLILIAPGALFPLMALFLWLDTGRYKAYLPLFAAGKCISIFSSLGWSIVSGRITMSLGFSGIVIAELILLSGDLFAMAAILLIIKDVRKMTEKPVLEVE